MKPEHITLAAKAVVASALLSDVVLAFRMRKAAKELAQSNDVLHQTNKILVDTGIALVEETAVQQRKIEFLLGKLTEHNVSIDEFEMIAFNNDLI